MARFSFGFHNPNHAAALVCALLPLCLGRLGLSRVLVLALFIAFGAWLLATNLHESPRIPIRADSCQFVDKTIDKIVTTNPSNPVNPVNPVKKTPSLPSSVFSVFSESNASVAYSAQISIRENPCQSVVKQKTRRE